jgi:spermidine/putrescine ABC transporter ATP-binding subunit
MKIQPGEFFSILGPSGCGKSTTLRMIAGFERPDSGTISINGEQCTFVPAHRRDTNMVFQQLALFPHLDVFDNIAFGLRVKHVARTELSRRVRDALELVGLAGFDQRGVQSLSGGQQQRVAIARALVNRPAVLLLDEPLGALDLKLRVQMQFELKSLQHRLGTTFIYVTHDQSEALTMSDRIAVMNGGRLEQIGPSADIYERPTTEFVATFIGETNLFRGGRLRRRGDQCVVRVDNLDFPIDDPIIASDAISISLRPERIRAGRAASEADVRVSGRIRTVVYGGSYIRLEVEVGPRLIVVQTPNTVEVRYSSGQELMLGWSAGDAVPISSTVPAAPSANSLDAIAQ